MDRWTVTNNSEFWPRLQGPRTAPNEPIGSVELATVDKVVVMGGEMTVGNELQHAPAETFIAFERGV